MEPQSPLWQPSEALVSSCHMTHFMQSINKQYHLTLSSYTELYQWSISNLDLFWQSVWDFCQIISHRQPTTVLELGSRIYDNHWFEGATLNFAENCLSTNGDHLAIIASNECYTNRCLTYNQLRAQVANLASYLRGLGLQSGDRVVAMMPNIPETVIAMLATTSLGGIWSSCSPDYGLPGLLDRFSQIKPSLLIACDSHYYKGKQFNHQEKITKLQNQLNSLKHTIIVPYDSSTQTRGAYSKAHMWRDCMTQNNDTLSFVAVPFNHPAFILYSSGTTGKPKCIVHSTGGTLLQHTKELMLHTNLHVQDRIFFHTTCGWMMWNWLISSLTVGATIVCYDGNPFYNNPSHFFDLIDQHQISIFGCGAKYIETIKLLNLNPSASHNLSSLHTILTTGSPLLPDSFDYVYEAIKPSVQLSSISGGSDIISCFALGNPLKPVYRGELQCVGLGMAVKIYDNAGHPTTTQPGELVCVKPFPSMPIGFWSDPDGSQYYHAYFDQFENVWTHGDYAQWTMHDGLIIFGRSDATLNPNGIRIGTAEIYQQVEEIPNIIECAAITQQWQDNERIILFVVLQKPSQLDDNLKQTIKTRIRDNASPHHVPKKIIQVDELPRTMNGKLAELAIKKTIHGEPLNNLSALANPNCLTQFKNLTELLNT